MKKTVLVCFLLVCANPSSATTGFLKGEQISGLNKICVYSSARGISL